MKAAGKSTAAAVAATFTTSNNAQQVKFDAAPWLAHAPEDRIVDILNCACAHSPACEEALRQLAPRNEELALLDAYCSKKPGVRPVMRLDREKVVAWAETHRPALWARIKRGTGGAGLQHTPPCTLCDAANAGWQGRKAG